MYGILYPLQDRPAPPSERDGGLEAVTLAFLRQAQRAALARFANDPMWSRGCHTAQIAVPHRPGGRGCTGAIVAHVSASLVRAWADAGPGSRGMRKAHVMEQLQLMLQDLRDQDMHAALALTTVQCDVYGQDLAQLVQESLERTTFSALRRRCTVHWEGTLVRSLQPPAFVLALSIGIEPVAPVA